MARDPDETPEERQARKEAKRARKEEKRAKRLQEAQIRDSTPPAEIDDHAASVDEEINPSAAAEDAEWSSSTQFRDKKRSKEERRAAKARKRARRHQLSLQQDGEDEDRISEEDETSDALRDTSEMVEMHGDRPSSSSTWTNGDKQNGHTGIQPSSNQDASTSSPLPPSFFPHHWKKFRHNDIDASDLPPGFDLSAITDQLRGSSSTDSPRSQTDQLAQLNAYASTPGFTLPDVSSSRSNGRGPSRAAFDAAVISTRGRSGEGVFRGRAKSVRSSERIAKSKELTIADAAGLSQEEILSRKLYQPHQLKWLEEAGILTNLVRGKFTQIEEDKLKGVIETFAHVHDMTEEEVIEILTSKTASQAEMYAELTSEMAASLEGRHLRSVRRFAAEHFHPGAKQGPWTEAQSAALAAAYSELGPKWIDIAKRVGRLARDCRTRWRDYGELVKESRQSGKWSQDEVEKLQAAVTEQCEALGLEPEDKTIPWSVVALRVGSRPANSCLRKWDEILHKKEKLQHDLLARVSAEEQWNTFRDEKLLVERLLDQKEALKRGSIKAVDWSKVPSPDLDFTRETLARSWRRLCKAHLPPEMKDATLEEQLNHLMPIVKRRFEDDREQSMHRQRMLSMAAAKNEIDSEEEV